MTEKTDEKRFPLRLSRELWYFLRRHSIDIELSMNQIIVSCMQAYKKKVEKNDKKELTEDNIMIP